MTSTLQYTTPSSARGPPMKASTAGFSCAFVPHNCAHDVIFSDVYLRTNRTNHTKIMRCFPHCCPDHRKRSYCGSAIHLQLLATKDAAPSTNPEDLVVYARFRPHTVAPLAPGERVAVSSILSSLQRENPSKGEWVESKLVRYDGSKGNSSWLYEVNPSGRWYYPWSGAATIAMRATEHVFEALAFRRVGDGVLELVTGTTSPNFRLMSFRRGIAGGKNTKAIAEPSDGSEEVSPKRQSSTRAPIVTAKKRSLPPSPARQPVPVSMLPPRFISTVHAPMHLLAPEFSPSLLHPSDPSHRRNGIYEARETPHVQPRLGKPLHSSDPVTASTTLESILPWLQDLPASTIGSRVMLAWERVVQVACDAHVLAARNGSSTGATRLSLVPILSALDVASSSSPSQALRQQEPSPSPLDVIDAAVRVLLHVWLDVDCVQTSDANVQRFLRHGFYPDRQQLAIAHAAWVQETEAHAKRFLHTQTRVPWAHLSAVTSARQRHGNVMPTHPSSDVFASRAFVARCRERFIHREEAHREASRSQKRQHTGLDSTRAGPRTSRVPPGLLSTARVWTSRMGDVSIEVDVLAPNALSLLTVIQFWKHLSRVRLDYDYTARSLSVASVFNASIVDACFMRLVLDGKYRWFHCLPGGDATTGTTFMGYVVGDYVGYTTSAGTVHATTYLWPAAADASHTAFAWHWTVDTASLATAHTSVSVVVESAYIQRPNHCDSFETMSITDKLDRVGRWQHVCQVQLAYEAQ